MTRSPEPVPRCLWGRSPPAAGQRLALQARPPHSPPSPSLWSAPDSRGQTGPPTKWYPSTSLSHGASFLTPPPAVPTAHSQSLDAPGPGGVCAAHHLLVPVSVPPLPGAHSALLTPCKLLPKTHPTFPSSTRAVSRPPTSPSTAPHRDLSPRALAEDPCFPSSLPPHWAPHLLGLHCGAFGPSFKTSGQLPFSMRMARSTPPP